MELEQLFADCLGGRYSTRLVGGAEEPLYRPAADAGEDHCIYYRLDYFASALHEVAHWCIAGPERRRQLDYGYWYCADGRNADQQRLFESVEVKPQAIEWHFALAAGHPFRISHDNLSGERASAPGFAAAVSQQAQLYCSAGLPSRADVFRRQLASRYGGAQQPTPDLFASAAL